MLTNMTLILTQCNYVVCCGNLIFQCGANLIHVFRNTTLYFLKRVQSLVSIFTLLWRQ